MQRRRRFRRAGVPSNATLSLLGKELREAHLQALLGGTSRSSGLSGLSHATDPLLSTLVYNVPITEAEDPPKPSAINEEPPSKLSSLSQQSKPRQVAPWTVSARSYTKLEVSYNSTWHVVNLPILVSFWYMLGGSMKIWLENVVYWFSKGQTILACPEVLKWVWPSMTEVGWPPFKLKNYLWVAP